MNHTQVLPSGTRIESYEIQKVLGIGGFGITYQAYDHVLNQTVAIKEYFPTDVAYRKSHCNTVSQQNKQDQEFYQYGLQRFLDEARTLAKFRNDNIVRISHYIQANATAYLIMDFEAGISLSQKLKHDKILPEDAIYHIMTPLLQGLYDVHQQNILHRDIKPSNILLRADHTPVLIDFGSARATASNQNTALTAVITPGYAPFEQYNGDNQGAWTDIYGLGATIYHCMTGVAPPFATLRISASYQKRADPTTASFKKLGTQYSKSLIQLIEWMIHSEPKKRPQTTTEVLNFIQKETSSSQQTNLLFKPNKLILNNSPPSINLQAQSINIENMTVSPDRLSINLAQAIGPIAKILIKKAQAQTSDPMQLVQSLAKHISSEQQRQQFIKQSGGSFPPKEAENISIFHEKNKESHSVTAITQDGLSHAINCLSYYLGPIAKILVNKIAQTVDSQEALITQLADELDNDEHRKDFIKRMKA